MQWRDLLVQEQRGTQVERRYRVQAFESLLNLAREMNTRGGGTLKKETLKVSHFTADS